MLRFRHKLSACAVALAVVLVAAGCAPGADPAPAAAPPSRAPSPSASSATPTPSATPSTAPSVAPAPVDVPPAPNPTEPPAPIETVMPFNKSANSIDDPNSLWVVSNKLRPLNPTNWAPPDIVTVPVAHQNPPAMRAIASAPLQAMFAAAVAEGAGALQVQSAYRSYDTQVRVYAGWVASLGKAQADAQSARPGFSEHQTGLSVDISPVPITCALDACFGSTPQGLWLAANAWRFGFLLRYPADKVAVTGYTYEPWHFRYIGTELSTEMHNTGVTTLEEFFGLPAAPDYAP